MEQQIRIILTSGATISVAKTNESETVVESALQANATGADEAILQFAGKTTGTMMARLLRTTIIGYEYVTIA